MSKAHWNCVNDNCCQRGASECWKCQGFKMSGARRGIPECKHQARPDQPELDFTIPELPAATVAYIEARIGEAESLAKWVLAKHQQHVNASIKKSQESW